MRPLTPPTVTPAMKKAMTGRAKPDDIGVYLSTKWWVSGYRTSWPFSWGVTPAREVVTAGTSRPRATPAMVACTSDACTNAHAATPNGINNHHACIPQRTSTANTANGNRAVRMRGQIPCDQPAELRT